MFRKLSLILVIFLFSQGVSLAKVDNTVLVNRLEKIIQQDIGSRGISCFWTNGALIKAARTINASSRVVIVTGFYITSGPGSETDGPTGAIAIADAARSLGKHVTIITDTPNFNVMKAAVLSSRYPDTTLKLVNTKEEIDQALTLVDSKTALIAMERPGRGKDGKYHSMSGIDISAQTAALDDIFLKAQPMTSIGIGDGGNEIGMGTKYDLITDNVSHGGSIATVVGTDILITSGVSNWAGYALAIALQIINPNKDVATPTVESDLNVLRGIVSAGAIDGITLMHKASVDGFLFPTHADIIRAMRIIMIQRIKK